MSDQPPVNEQQPVSPRKRLQTLLAIPDSQRTEAQWDEINELEISLAPGNRIDAPLPRALQPITAHHKSGGGGGGGGPKSGGGGGGPKPGGGGGGRHKPPGGGGGGGKGKKPFRKSRNKQAKPEAG